MPYKKIHRTVKKLTTDKIKFRKEKEAGLKNLKKLKNATKVAHFISPTIASTFVVVYWIVGMYNAKNP